LTNNAGGRMRKLKIRIGDHGFIGVDCNRREREGAGTSTYLRKQLLNVKCQMECGTSTLKTRKS